MLLRSTCTTLYSILNICGIDIQGKNIGESTIFSNPLLHDCTFPRLDFLSNKIRVIFQSINGGSKGRGNKKIPQNKSQIANHIIIIQRSTEMKSKGSLMSIVLLYSFNGNEHVVEFNNKNNDEKRPVENYYRSD